jgi:ubiquinone/menaquinone biosynthesis C-methylase UbiE
MDTSWEKAADWYDALLAGEGTYQKELILPNLTRLMGVARGDVILDLACGQGFFAREFARRGAKVVGVEASRALVDIARAAAPGDTVTFRVAEADSLPFIKNKSIDKIAVVLALQNMENIAGVFRECARVVKPGGSLHVVINHPAFRIPQGSSWGWDEKQKVQYRRIDQYLSESKIKIQTHPGDSPKDYTWSFHRPLQFYVKALRKAGFSLSALEEWNSHKKSEPGPRAKAEDFARKEIPLFLYYAAILGR